MRNGTIQCFLQQQRIIVYRDRSNIESCTSNFPTFKRDNLKMTTVHSFLVLAVSCKVKIAARVIMILKCTNA